jgi:hypothetical protein
MEGAVIDEAGWGRTAVEVFYIFVASCMFLSLVVDQTACTLITKKI